MNFASASCSIACHAWYSLPVDWMSNLSPSRRTVTVAPSSTKNASLRLVIPFSITSPKSTMCQRSICASSTSHSKRPSFNARRSVLFFGSSPSRYILSSTGVVPSATEPTTWHFTCPCPAASLLTPLQGAKGTMRTSMMVMMVSFLFISFYFNTLFILYTPFLLNYSAARLKKI